MNEMMPELGYMLQGVGTAIAGVVIAMACLRIYQATNQEPAPVGSALDDMNLRDLVLRLNIIDGADNLIDLAFKSPQIFLMTGAVAHACMFYCDEVHVTKLRDIADETEKGTRVFARYGDSVHTVTDINSTRATIQACCYALKGGNFGNG